MTDLLWHIPDKPDNISIGRKRIATGLSERGFNVTLMPADPRNAVDQLRDSYDVVMTTTAAGGVFGPLATVQRTPYIVDYVDPITQMRKSSNYRKAKFAELLQASAFRAADGICYVYDEERNRVKSYGKPLLQTRLGVDYHRFDDPSPRAVEAADRILQQHRVTDDYAIYIGGLEDIYHVPVMLDAAKLGGYEFVIAGTGSHRAEVEQAATAFDNIHYLDVVDHEWIPGLLDRAAAGVCLVDDPHTVKVLEYAAADVPVVQARGRAEAELPSGDVQWTDADAEAVRAAVEGAMDRGGAGHGMRRYANEHQWRHVVDDYTTMIDQVV